MKNTVRILAHVLFVLSVTTIVLLILHYYNPMMGFLSSGFSLAILLALAAVGAVLAVLVLYRDGRDRS